MRAASPPSCDGDMSLVPETWSQKALEEQGCCGGGATFHWGVALRLHRVRAELQPQLRPHRPPAHPQLCPGWDLLQRQLCPHPLRGETFQVLPLWAGLQSHLLLLSHQWGTGGRQHPWVWSGRDPRCSSWSRPEVQGGGQGCDCTRSPGLQIAGHSDAFGPHCPFQSSPPNTH